MGNGGVRVAHVSDTHIGYEAFRRLTSSGENQRGHDVIAAFHRAVADIVAWDPPLVVHSGDVAEKPVIPMRHMRQIRNELAALASIRPDGSRRQVVVIAGNHDAPAHRREPCFLELFADVIPGLHIVTDRMKVIEFSDGPDVPAELANVAVTAIPHDTLKDLEQNAMFDTVAPVDNKVNVLVAHGVAGGSTLYHRTIGREYHIPTEVLGRNWDYVALGHWHRQGPISLTEARKNTTESHIWYAGSTENMGYGDLLDNTRSRGWLKVGVQHGQLPQVETSQVPNRPMFRLPVIECSGKTPEELTAELTENADKARKSGKIAQAVVEQIVKDVPADIWNLVDTNKARQLMEPTLNFNIRVDRRRVDATETSEENAAEEEGLEKVNGFDRLRGLVVSDIAPDVLKDCSDEVAEAAVALILDTLRAEMKLTDDTDTNTEGET